jgi:hypothetical protein
MKHTPEGRKGEAAHAKCMQQLYKSRNTDKQIKLHAVPATSRTQMNIRFCVLFPFLLEKIIDCTDTLYSRRPSKVTFFIARTT